MTLVCGSDGRSHHVLEMLVLVDDMMIDDVMIDDTAIDEFDDMMLALRNRFAISRKSCE